MSATQQQLSVQSTALSLTDMADRKIKLVFQGDSITDAGRDKRNYFNLGRGYANAAAENLKAAYPEKALEFINLGINGNRTSELFDRLYPDCIFLKPDVVSVMIGINDVWHEYAFDKNNGVSSEKYEKIYSIYSDSCCDSWHNECSTRMGIRFGNESSRRHCDLFFHLNRSGYICEFGIY